MAALNHALNRFAAREVRGDMRERERPRTIFINEPISAILNHRFDISLVTVTRLCVFLLLLFDPRLYEPLIENEILLAAPSLSSAPDSDSSASWSASLQHSSLRRAPHTLATHWPQPHGLKPPSPDASSRVKGPAQTSAWTSEGAPRPALER